MPMCLSIPSTPVCPSLIGLAAVRTPHHIGSSALPHSQVEKTLANDEDIYKLHRAKAEAWGTWKRCRYYGRKPPVPLLEWGVNRDSLRFSLHWVCDETHSWAIWYSHCLVGYCFYVPWRLHRLRLLLLCNKCPQTEQLTTIIISLSLVILWVDCAQLCGRSTSCDVSGSCIWGAWLGWTPKMASLHGWQLGLALLGTVQGLLIRGTLFSSRWPFQEIWASHNMASEFQERAFQKAKVNAANLLRPCFRDTQYHFWQAIDERESRGQPKFNVVRLLLTGHHLWELIMKNIKQVCIWLVCLLVSIVIPGLLTCSLHLNPT